MGLEELRRIREDRDKPKPQKKYVIPKKSAKKIAQEKAQKEQGKVEKTELEKWYDGIMQKEDGICWETGKKINKADKVGWHGSICHIIPKSIFTSVATHPKNYLILSMWDGVHGTYDSSWGKASKMKVWSIAMDRLMEFESDISEDEYKKLPEIILKEIQKRKNVAFNI